MSRRSAHTSSAAAFPGEQKKLKRVQAAVKRQARKEDGSKHESFAALQLLHDPQVRACLKALLLLLLLPIVDTASAAAAAACC